MKIKIEFKYDDDYEFFSFVISQENIFIQHNVLDSYYRKTERFSKLNIPEYIK